MFVACLSPVWVWKRVCVWYPFFLRINSCNLLGESFIAHWGSVIYAHKHMDSRISSNQFSWQYDQNRRYSLFIAGNLRTSRTQRVLDEVDVNRLSIKPKCFILFASSDKGLPHHCASFSRHNMPEIQKCRLNHLALSLAKYSVKLCKFTLDCHCLLFLINCETV